MMSQEEAMAYFRNMPSKRRENPHWRFDTEKESIVRRDSNEDVSARIINSKEALCEIRNYFRNVYESFKTESQVLLVTVEDGKKLEQIGLPRLGGVKSFAGIEVDVFVLPQVNTFSNSIISESFWQKYIVEQGIVPVARVHSHHVLDAYQSSTDYATLNSNSLELVMGHINDDGFSVAYWLDEHGTDTKANVFWLSVSNGGNEFATGRLASGRVRFEQK